MKRLPAAAVLLLLFLTLSGVFTRAAAQVNPETNNAIPAWGENKRLSFEQEGRKGFLIVPVQAAAGKPWLWSDAAVAPGLVASALLEKGFHLAWMEVGDLYGNPQAVSFCDAFYSWAVKEQGLAAKPALMGKKESALTLFSWAAQNLEESACLVAESPWLDLQESSEKDSGLLTKVRAAHGIASGVDAAGAPGAPVNMASRLGEAAVPLLFLHDKADESSPWEKQADEFYRACRNAGRGPFENILKTDDADSPDSGTVLHTLYFLLKFTEQLEGGKVGAPFPAMPQWETADFAGRADTLILDDVIIIEKGGEMTGIRWIGPRPKEEYEITLEAMRLSGGDFFCGLTAPWKDSAFSLIIGGWGGTCVGISSLDWLDAYNNETAQFRTYQPHHWYPVKLRVTKERIQAWVNKEQLVDLEVGGHEVDIRWEMDPTRPLGIATWCTTGAIRNFKITNL